MNMLRLQTGDEYYPALPAGSEKIKGWTIYDLVDDWVVHSARTPGIQILLFFMLLAAVTASMVFVTTRIAAFPNLSIIASVVILLILLVLTIVFHELCHAVAILCYGGKPRFGAKWMRGLGPVVYVTTDGYFKVYAYRRIAAAPLFIVTAVCFIGVALGYGWWFIIPFVFNSVGAGGDMLSMRALRKYSGNDIVEDTEDGFTVYGKRD